MTIEIQPVDPGADEVAALVARHLAFAAGVTPPDHVHALDALGLADAAVTLYGARRDGALVGMGALRRLDDDHVEIKSMHVAVEARGLGVGRAVLDHLLAEASGRGHGRVSLETGTGEAFAAAHALYASAGFTTCPPFAEYTDNPYSTCMTRSLDGSGTR